MVNAEVVRETSEQPETLDLGAIYAQSFHDFQEGQVVKGRIVAITGNDVVVDVGYKSEGVIPLSEFGGGEALSVGQEIEVLVEAIEDEEGMVVLSKERAQRSQGWDRFIGLHKEGSLIEGKVVRKVKGGLMVDIGVEAFLPASLASLRGYADVSRMVGEAYKFKVIKINKSRKNVVLSRKDVLMVEKEEARSKLLDTLTPGELRTGTVKNLTDFGAFIDLGGIDGLLHISDMSWGRIGHPNELLTVGQKIEVKILDFDKTQMKISLGLKQKSASPWEGVDQKYPVGSRVKGKVVNLMPYGAFVELEPGIEGLVHVSELSWTKRVEHPNQVLNIGDAVDVVVLNVDKTAQKIALGYKQAQSNPWSEVASKYPVGTRVTGKVRNITDFGAFVELPEGIEGLIHVSDMSWTRKVNHPGEIVKKGQMTEAVVVSVDPENQKLALGVKQLNVDPWPEFLLRYMVGSVVDGQITKITNFGLFIELEKDLEGLVHVSEADPKVVAKGAPLAKAYKPGDTVHVRVIRVDDEKRQIGLTMKDVG